MSADSGKDRSSDEASEPVPLVEVDPQLERLRRPLLLSDRELQEANARPRREQQANIFSLAFLFFVQPVISLAEKLDTEMEVEHLDLPFGPNSCVQARSAFAAIWQKEVERHQGAAPNPATARTCSTNTTNEPIADSTKGEVTKPSSSTPPPPPPKQGNSLYWALLSFIKWPMLGAQLCGILEAAGPFVSIILMGEIDRFVGSSQTDDPDPLWYGAILALIFFVSNVVYTIAAAQAGKQLARIELRIDAALKSAILAKTATITDEAAAAIGGTGALYQMFQGDVNRIANTLPGTWRSLDIVLQTLAALIYLGILVGWPALSVIVVFFILLPMNHKIADSAVITFIKRMKASDQRTNKIVEVLNAIRAVKLYAWEKPFLKITQKLRAPELESLVLLMKQIAYLMCSFSFAAPLMQIVMYVLLVYATEKPSVVVFFQSLSLIAIIRNIMTRVSFTYTRYLQALTAVQRVELVLLGKERQPSEYDGPLVEGQVIVEDGSFQWPCPPPGTRQKTRLGRTKIKREVVDAAEGSMVSQEMKHVTFSANPGELVMIVGKVGSGKSSLVTALAGEMKHLGGKLGRKGTVAYVPQTPWILNTSLRNNIILNQPFEQEKYDKVVHASDLVADLLTFPLGDLTEIGEKGINLSGGQRQRVSLARALYSDADIYLFDDPLSALDVHVGRHVFEVAIQELLADKTRILVTHQMQLLQHADRLYVANGMVITEETLPPLDHLLDEEENTTEPAELDPKGDYPSNETATGPPSSTAVAPSSNADILRSMLRAWYAPSEGSPKGITPTPTPSAATATAARENNKTSPGADKKKRMKDSGSQQSPSSSPTAKDGRLTVKEERESGRVKTSTVFAYFASFGGVGFWGAIIGLNLLIVAGSVFSQLWFSFWLEHKYPSFHSKYPDGFFMGIYIGSIAISILLAFIREVGVWRHGAVHAPKKMYDQMFMSVVSSPLSFFDVTPVGRIMTRFTKDTASLDFQLPFAAAIMITSFFGQLGAVVATCVVVPWSTPLFVVAIAVLMFVQPTVATLVFRRLASAASSPVFGLYSETLAGVSSIRIQGLVPFFARRFDQKMDERNAAAYTDRLVYQNIKVRIHLLIAFVSAGLMLVIMLTREQLDHSLAVFGIANVMRLSLMTGTLMIQRAEFMMSMNSVERIVEYSHLEGEKGGLDAPPQNWPSGGAIRIEHLKAQYRPNLPLVLNDVNLTINAGEKIGVAGRTGSGKSSFILTLFRLIPLLEDSRIEIDGVDTSTIPLSVLRSQIASIPQEPVLFQGTVADNLDPSQETPVEDMINALTYCHLIEPLTKLAIGVEKKKRAEANTQSAATAAAVVEMKQVTADGVKKEEDEIVVAVEQLVSLRIAPTDLSIGQRQLLCLARAVVRQCRILVMDEATSSVDVVTDNLIQETIRTVFKDATVITIAHRLNTIMDSDRVMVFDHGELVEMDSPAALLADEDSMFAGLAAGTSLVAADGAVE